jgi:hypothetical protein
MKLDIRIDHRHITDKLAGYAQGQARFLVSNTLNGVAFDIKNHIQKTLPIAFDRPTRYTLNSLAVEKSQKDTLKAEVIFKDSQAEQGKAAREYIRPGALGASKRNQKRSEYLLTRNGVLPAGWVLTAGKFLAGKLDGYGNVPGSYYKQVINLLQLKRIETDRARNQSLASQKRAAKMGVSDEFFAVQPGKNNLARNGGWLPPGIWKRTGRKGEKPVQYFKFVKKASYKVRLDIDKEARGIVQASAQANWDKTVAYIIRDLSK